MQLERLLGLLKKRRARLVTQWLSPIWPTTSSARPRTLLGLFVQRRNQLKQTILAVQSADGSIHSFLSRSVTLCSMMSGYAMGHGRSLFDW